MVTLAYVHLNGFGRRSPRARTAWKCASRARIPRAEIDDAEGEGEGDQARFLRASGNEVLASC